jgi:hypothetical protein
VWLDDPRHLPGIARHLQRHPVLVAEASGEQLKGRRGIISIRPAERISPRSAIATSQKSRWMSRPIGLIVISSSSLA